ncbi:ABC-three component system middle component 7 [Vibrio splendidus]|uniref:ABC-three component system middle component 7 n=1 Tax=Vibrio splendidus TaxID=29497 RepID=UPI000D3B577D|nr:ABC-three component system middle component 7 [Vibrio splendidus]PTP93877.1 hypothetical protein CWO02_06245 [Vibrio splendidus]
MILPNKSLPFKKTIVFKMVYILEADFDEITVSDLYKKTKSKFDNLDEFVCALDVLYVLDKVEINEIGIIKNVKVNILR